LACPPRTLIGSNYMRRRNSHPGRRRLDSSTINQLHNTIRSSPRPALEGFTKAFRKRFLVPADVPSIADRICQRRHHDWIEAFLVQHQQLAV
jgi:hypothetical protein